MQKWVIALIVVVYLLSFYFLPSNAELTDKGIKCIVFIALVLLVIGFFKRENIIPNFAPGKTVWRKIHYTLFYLLIVTHCWGAEAVNTTTETFPDNVSWGKGWSVLIVSFITMFLGISFWNKEHENALNNSPHRHYVNDHPDRIYVSQHDYSSNMSFKGGIALLAGGVGCLIAFYWL